MPPVVVERASVRPSKPAVDICDALDSNAAAISGHTFEGNWDCHQTLYFDFSKLKYLQAQRRRFSENFLGLVGYIHLFHNTVLRYNQIRSDLSGGSFLLHFNWIHRRNHFFCLELRFWPTPFVAVKHRLFLFRRKRPQDHRIDLPNGPRGRILHLADKFLRNDCLGKNGWLRLRRNRGHQREGDQWKQFHRNCAL